MENASLWSQRRLKEDLHGNELTITGTLAQAVKEGPFTGTGC